MIFIWLLAVVVLIVLLTVTLKLHPFFALISGAIIMGFLGGLETAVLLDALTGGFGATLGSIGIVIAAGAIIGEYLGRSGGAKKLADKILDMIGEKNAPLSMSLAGYMVSIPVFCDSGFIVLSALNKAIAKKTGISLAVLAVALSTGLYATHVFVPPTPGPLAAAATLGADVGRVLLLGLLVSLPVTVAALLWAVKGCAGYTIEFDVGDDEKTEQNASPSFALALLPIVLPIVLIALKSIAELDSLPFGDGLFFQALYFAGNPVVALLIGAACSFLMVTNGKKIKETWLEEGLKKAGTIILITGAGGAFGSVLRATDIGVMAEQFASVQGLGVLLPFLIAAFLKTAQGSSTVAIITAAAITAPLLAPSGFDTPTGTALVVLAIGAGALTVSHVNDSYFWVVAKFSDMDTSTALKTHTVATCIMGITGLVTIQILSWILM